jgi:N-acetyl-anhydromuramyl-L-alanine amidase AmpD
MVIFQRPSPNQNRRPIGVDVSAVVLHADASTATSGTLSWLRRKESGVSYHYLIGRAGHVYECVNPLRRAWHAGVSAFDGVKDCNNYRVGVCFSNNMTNEEYSDQQIEAGAELVAGLMHKYPAITLERITTHQAVARPAGRKQDPGPRFPMAVFLSRVQHFYDADPLKPAA